MADFSIPLTIPDDRVDDALATIRYAANDQNLTAAEAKAYVKERVKEMLRRWHEGYLRKKADQADDLGAT